MQLPDENVWRKIPGQTADDGKESDSEDDDGDGTLKERRARARRGVEEVSAVLGERWLDVQCVEFTPVAPTYNSGSLPPRLPPSQWGTSGPPLSFRLEHVRAPVVQDTLIANGLTQTKGKEWLVMWSGPRMRDKEYQGLHELQRVNHFPGSTELTRKDRICVHFERMAKRFGREGFDFLPETYVLPKQMDEFLAVHEAKPDHIWIVKPNASSQGKGIYLMKNLEDLPQSQEEITVVSEYIHRPLLIQGLKFDIRVYVLVTSFEPLRAYVYREGLIRFASQPYSTEDKHLNDAYRHLTNYSINKKADNFVENQKAHQDNVGHKWSFSAFNKHLKHCGVNVELIWARIMDLILKTLISVKQGISTETKRATAHCANCFELYGFDVLVDEDLKPWLVEVNLSPSMLAESPLDQQVKSAVLSDTFNIVGVANASWRTLAAAKLRSQLIQMRHSMNVVGASAEAFRNPDAPAGAIGADGNLLDVEERASKLAEMTERELKMIAQALKEVTRCNNFVRLYPTKTTVERYAPLLRAPSPMQKIYLQMLLGQDVCFGDEEEEDEIVEVEPKARKKPSSREKLKPPEALSSEDKAEIARATANAFKKAEAGVGPPPEQRPESPSGIVDWTGLKTETEHSSFLTTMAMGVLKPLTSRVASRLVLIEYLVRLINTCRATRARGRSKLKHTSAHKRLGSFRQQLAIFLRTTAANAGLPRPSTDDAEGDFITQMVAICRAGLTCVAKELWVSSGNTGPIPSSPAGSKALLDTSAQLPPAFAKSGRGEKVLETLDGLSSGDLEFVLQGPDCHPEFASLLGNLHVTPDEDFVHGFAELQMLIEGCRGSPGPLSELLRALTAIDEPPPTLEAPPEDTFPIAKSAVPGTHEALSRCLPSIVPGVPMMAQGAATAPAATGRPQETLASARSASVLARMSYPGVDMGPRQRPRVPGAVSRTTSLPALRPTLSPQKPAYRGLASLGPSKTPQKQIRYGGYGGPGGFGMDFMNNDIEF